MNEIRSSHNAFQTRLVEKIMRQRKIKNDENEKPRPQLLIGLEK
jgi:hypothetical protein